MLHIFDPSIQHFKEKITREKPKYVVFVNEIITPLPKIITIRNVSVTLSMIVVKVNKTSFLATYNHIIKFCIAT